MQGLESLLVVVLVAALAPMIVAALPGPGIPQVVVLILAGVLIGPQGLGLASTAGIRLLSDVGLGFLFLLAGYELDLRLLRAHPGRLAIIGWVISAVIAVGAVTILGSFGFLRAFVPIGLALTTTALGTLLPILHDHHMLSGEFGRYVLAAGAVGELFPIVAISLFLTGRGEFVAITSILAVGVMAILLTLVLRIIGPRGSERSSTRAGGRPRRRPCAGPSAKPTPPTARALPRLSSGHGADLRTPLSVAPGWVRILQAGR